jgi:endonuclease G
MKPLDFRQLRGVAERFAKGVGRKKPAAARAAVLPQPTDQRKSWLAVNLSRERARAAVSEAEARGAVRDGNRTLLSLARERIIGSNDLRDINYLELAIAIARAVCRIRIGSAAGTGFLVGPGVLMTNHHVLESADDARQAEAQFDVQDNMSGEMLPIQPYRLDPSTLFLTDPELDFTVVATAPQSAHGRPVDRYPWLQLIGSLGKAEKGDPLNIIQHPRGGLKQIALRNNEVIEVPQGKTRFLYYTTDTEPGSSGSPCLNDQWELVALHHSGVPATRNGEILRKDGKPWREGVDDAALINWIANEGGRVSAIVEGIRDAGLSGAAAELRDRMLNSKPPNPVELARTESSGTASANRGGIVNQGSGMSFTVPLTVTVSIGSAPAVPAQPAPGSPTGQDGAVATEALRVDPDWSTRKGYLPNFLGQRVPLPTLSEEMRKATVIVPKKYRLDGDPHVLPYHHFSLAMNESRRFAWYSAAMIDGDRRPKLPERKDDKWAIDSRIDDVDHPAVQCGEELYATQKTDRGHLTRYLDVAWGDDRAEALNALADTFHFTNCCLQLSEFNQGKDRWQGIERYLLENKARKEKRRIAVITGPLFGPHDPNYRNTFMKYSVRIPLAFWKVCAIIRQNGTLSATAFILSQKDVAELPGFEAAFDVTAVQVTIADLEERSGLRFPELRDNDHFAGGGVAGTLEVDRPGGKRPILPLRSYEDIVV